MKVAVVGGVKSTEKTVRALVRHGFDVRAVVGYEPKDPALVSGFVDLKALGGELDLPYIGFSKINDHSDAIAALEVDVLFVVGLSQLVCDEIMALPRIGAIGFHPTDLPRGRGRAPIAWLVERQERGAACFFQLVAKADAGPIFVKEPFEVDSDDDAGSVEEKLLGAMDRALDRWLPNLRAGLWDPQPQEESQATEYGARRPEDGLLDFSNSALALDRRIKAAAPPHPGAFTFFEHHKIRVLKSRIEEDLKIRGCWGRILKINGSWHLLQTGDGLLWVELEDAQGDLRPPRVGQRLGYLPQLEIHRLHQELEALKQLVKRTSL